MAGLFIFLHWLRQSPFNSSCVEERKGEPLLEFALECNRIMKWFYLVVALLSRTRDSS